MTANNTTDKPDLQQQNNADTSDLTMSAEDISAVLQQEILVDQYVVGEFFPTERELGQRFSVSRSVIRSSLLQLQLKGFLEVSNTKRPRVKKPSIERILLTTGNSLRELIGDVESVAYLEQVRHFIEVGAIRAVIKDASTLQLAQIREALTDCHCAIGNREAFIEADISFHRALVAVLDNPIILKLHDMFVSRMLKERPETEDRKALDQRSYEEHRALLEAIISGDVELAVDVMDKHMVRSYRQRMVLPDKLE